MKALFYSLLWLGTASLALLVILKGSGAFTSHNVGWGALLIASGLFGTLVGLRGILELKEQERFGGR